MLHFPPQIHQGMPSPLTDLIHIAHKNFMESTI